jgi:antitoxin VapB
MGLSIKNEETERLVRELARRRGLGVTRAIKLAVNNELAKDGLPKKDPEKVISEIRELQRRWAEFPPLDMKEIDDWMYDENGLPH